MVKKSTIFCDIDGTLIKYRKFETYLNSEPQPVQNMIDTLQCIHNEGHCIVLTTARPEYLRNHTKTELSKLHIPYDQLVMGLARGNRILINDKENPENDRTFAINTMRDEGCTYNQLLETVKTLDI